jgi:hypothetical protein
MMKYHFYKFFPDMGLLFFENDEESGKESFVRVEDCYRENGCTLWNSKNPPNALFVTISPHKDNDLCNRADNFFHEKLPLIDWRTPAGAKQIVDELLRRGFTEHDLRYGVPTAEEREALKELNNFELVG